MNKYFLGLTVNILATTAFAANPASSAVSAAPASSAIVSSVAPAAAATSSAQVSLPIETAAPAPKKISVAAIFDGGVGAEAVHKGKTEGQSRSTQILKVKYDLGKKRKVELAQYFYYNVTDSSQTDEMIGGEHVLGYSDASIAKIADQDLAAYAKIFLPGTSRQREVGQHHLRLGGSLSQSVSKKLSLEYSAEGRVYAYSKDASAQVGGVLTPSITATYEANRFFNPYAALATDHRWYNRGQGLSLADSSNKARSAKAALRSDLLITDLGSNVNVDKNISVGLYMENVADLHAGKAYDLFDRQNNSYNLTLSASM